MVKQQVSENKSKDLLRYASLNRPEDDGSLYTDNGKHLVNSSHKLVHVVRRSQVLNQAVGADGEKVFKCTTKKPLDRPKPPVLNSYNSYSLFLNRDPEMQR